MCLILAGIPRIIKIRTMANATTTISRTTLLLTLLTPSPKPQPILQSVAECLTPTVAQRLLSIEVDPTEQARVDELASKANEGKLTPAERNAYEQLIEEADLLGIIKSLARQALAE